MKKLLIITALILFNYFAFSQTGGNSTYNFLNLTSCARIASMGGDFLAIKDDDITLALTNPSIISKNMNNHLALNFIDYYTDVNYGFASYSRTFKKYGSFCANMQFIDYGKFTRADETGETYGNFNAGEYALSIGWGRALDSSFFIGANFKSIYSALESYNSFGIAADIAATYYNADKQITATFIAKNIGRQLHTYSGTRESLPFEIQLGMSKKMEHIPFRFSLLYNHLEKYDLTYENPDITNTIDPISGDTLTEKRFNKFTDNLMRHFVFGGEFSITKNFSLRAGYNYQRRKELMVDSKASTIGFSWGIGFRVSKFNFSYSRAAYHLAGSPNYITLTTNISSFYKKN